MARARQLSGHTLQYPVLRLPDCEACADPPTPKNYRSQPGHGLCSCGELSEHMATQVERKRWHTEHKGTVRARLVETWLRSTYRERPGP